MTLDPAQRHMLELALGEQADGKWSAFEVADIQPRQNGKGDTIQARELAGLFLFGEELLIHTAHEFATANEAFLRIVAVIESDRSLSSKVQRIRFANGEQGVELKSGARLKYRARTGGAGRGFAGAALVVYDEAYALTAEHVAASLPTLSTHPNPQVWLASSAGLSTSTALWALRRRAIEGDAGRLAYSEFTAEQPELDADGRVVSQPVDIFDDELVAQANPAYPHRITPDFVAAERAAMTPETFARERLGVFDPILGDAARPVKLPADRWESTVIGAPPAIAAGEVTLAFSVNRDGSHASIAIAHGEASSPYVELVEHRPDVGWLPDRLVDLVQRWEPTALGCNGAGASASQVGPVLAALRAAGLTAEIDQLSAGRYKAACGGLFADVLEGRLRRLAGQDPLDLAAGDATERPLGDAWAWDMRQATVPISPLDAVTVARALLTEAPAVEAPPSLVAF